MARPGVSEMVSLVFFIAIAIAAISLALTIAMPQITTMEDTAALENSITFLTELDTTIQDVASGGRYSRQHINLRFERGTYGFNPDRNELYYEIETDSPIISSHSTQNMGPVRLSANTDVAVSNTTIDGTDCYLMENRYIAACIRRVNDTNAGTINTSQLLIRLHNKATGTTLNGTLYTQINGSITTRDGVEDTSVERMGSDLGRGRVTAQVNTTNEGDYTITYELLSGADFLTVRVDADQATTGLQFVIDDRSSDIVYIDDQQRSPGVYNNNDIDFGYGIGQGTAMMGGVVAGSGFTRVGYDDAVAGGRYEINVTNSDDSIFLIPFTAGSVADVEDREELIRDGVIGRFFSYPAPNFGYELSDQKTVRGSLSYDHIRIDGLDRTLSPGSYQLMIENDGVVDGKTNVSVKIK